MLTNIQRIKVVGSKRKFLKYHFYPPNYTLIVHRAITNRTLQFFINNSRLASRSIFIKATEQTLPQPQLCLIVKTNHGLRLMSAHLHSSHEQFFEHPEKPLPQILLHETFSPEKHDQPDYFLSHLTSSIAYLSSYDPTASLSGKNQTHSRAPHSAATLSPVRCPCTHYKPRSCTGFCTRSVKNKLNELESSRSSSSPV